MLPPQFGRRKHRGYYRDHHELEDGDGVLLAGILLAIWGIYWLVVHWIDWAIGNLMVWWVEPLTLFVTLPIMITFSLVIDKYESWNPLHWWPMFWGTKIMIDRETDFYMAFDPEEFVQNHGGKYNVFCSTDSNEELYVKFRRKRDAVVYSLKNL
jgi:hypothetical protein